MAISKVTLSDFFDGEEIVLVKGQKCSNERYVELHKMYFDCETEKVEEIKTEKVEEIKEDSDISIEEQIKSIDDKEELEKLAREKGLELDRRKSMSKLKTQFKKFLGI